MDLVSASEEARVCLSVIRAGRNDDSVWDVFLAKASSIAEVYNIARSTTRTTERRVGGGVKEVYCGSCASRESGNATIR